MPIILVTLNYILGFGFHYFIHTTIFLTLVMCMYVKNNARIVILERQQGIVYYTILYASGRSENSEDWQ